MFKNVCGHFGKNQRDNREEDRKQEELNSILNKITPRNYQTLRDKLVAVGISSAITLRGLVDQASTSTTLTFSKCGAFNLLRHQPSAACMTRQGPCE